MTHYDEKMQLLQLQMEQKKHGESKLKTLYRQRESLEIKVRDLEKRKLAEQADVERVEGGSLTAFFYGVLRKKDEKLNKEREEAYGARVRYDAAARELRGVEEDIQRFESELKELGGCQEKYEQALKEKLEAIKALGTEESKEILRVEEHLAYLAGQSREIQGALRAGQTALKAAEGVLASLDSAAGWGTWDLMGGGLLTDMIKHGHLKDAQQQVEDLQVQLRRFKTELTDVAISGDMQVSIDGFLYFADYFFDGFLADWAVLDRINQAQARVQDTKNQIQQVLSRLTAMSRDTDKSLKREKDVLKELITKTAI